MRPTNAIIFLEQKHSDMYAFFAKKPNVGRGLFFVCGAVSALAPAVKLLVQMVESIFLLVINLIGAVFDRKLLIDAKFCAVKIGSGVVYAFTVLPFACVVHAIATVFMMIWNPKSYAESNRNMHQIAADCHRLYNCQIQTQASAKFPPYDSKADTELKIKLIDNACEAAIKGQSAEEVLKQFELKERLEFRIHYCFPYKYLCHESLRYSFKLHGNKEEFDKVCQEGKKIKKNVFTYEFFHPEENLKKNNKTIEDAQRILDATILLFSKPTAI